MLYPVVYDTWYQVVPRKPKLASRIVLGSHFDRHQHRTHAPRSNETRQWDRPVGLGSQTVRQYEHVAERAYSSRDTLLIGSVCQFVLPCSVQRRGTDTELVRILRCCCTCMNRSTVWERDYTYFWAQTCTTDGAPQLLNKGSAQYIWILLDQIGVLQYHSLEWGKTEGQKRPRPFFPIDKEASSYQGAYRVPLFDFVCLSVCLSVRGYGLNLSKLFERQYSRLELSHTS